MEVVNELADDTSPAKYVTYFYVSSHFEVVHLSMLLRHTLDGSTLISSTA